MCMANVYVTEANVLLRMPTLAILVCESSVAPHLGIITLIKLKYEIDKPPQSCFVVYKKELLVTLP